MNYISNEVQNFQISRRNGTIFFDYSDSFFCCLRRPPGSPPGAPSRRGFFYAASCAKTYPSLFRSSVRIGEYRELAAPIGLRQPSGGPPGGSSMEFHGVPWSWEKATKMFLLFVQKKLRQSDTASAETNPTTFFKLRR